MKPPRLADVVIVTFSLVFVILLFNRMYSGNSDSADLVIRVDDAEWRYTLDIDRDILVPGPLGETHVHVHDGQVLVEDSPCKNKVCIAAGSIQRTGDWIVCLPNKVFISIESSQGGTVTDPEVDDIAF